MLQMARHSPHLRYQETTDIGRHAAFVVLSFST